MKITIVALGAVLVVAGIVGLVHPDFTYHQKKEVAKLGPVQATVEEEKNRDRPDGSLRALAGRRCRTRALWCPVQKIQLCLTSPAIKRFRNAARFLFSRLSTELLR